MVSDGESSLKKVKPRKLTGTGDRRVGGSEERALELPVERTGENIPPSPESWV